MTTPKTFEHKGRFLKLAEYNAPSRPAPARKLSAQAPGAGKFQIGQVSLNQTDSELEIKAQISGKNIAYIFAEILLKDGEQHYGPVLREYVSADRNKETGGIVRPNWDENINLSVTLRPRLSLLTDGAHSAFAFTVPAGYGISGRRLDGQYTGAESQMRAHIAFDGDGNITEITAFKERGTRSAPRAITPKPGDTFAPFVQTLTSPAEEDGKWETTTALSTALTFGEKPFQLVDESPLPGEYLAGILIQDLDGKFSRKYASFTFGG
jgi:hypothetical protein